MLISNVPRLATPSPLHAVAVIPSRYGAERFPGKPLHPIAGTPMVLRVLERALQARRISLVLVATDDERIARAVETAGGRAVTTDPALPSGTDRVWAAVKDLDVEVVLNVQGDEPLMDPENIDRVAGFLLEHPEFPLATVALAIDDPAEIASPNNVKVVRADDGRALYFLAVASPLPPAARTLAADAQAPRPLRLPQGRAQALDEPAASSARESREPRAAPRARGGDGDGGAGRGERLDWRRHLGGCEKSGRNSS